MKPEELRIGNKILYAPKQEIISVSHSLIRHHEMYGDNADYLPIALTPEILIRSGFLKERDLLRGFDVKEHFMSFKLRHLRVSFIDGAFNQLHIGSGSTLLKHIKYLHQLQNVFYALFNVELPYSTPPLNGANATDGDK